MTHSRTRSHLWRVALAAVLVGALLALAGGDNAQAQTGFTVVKVTFEGGGGQSAAGRFTLAGTAGQADAGQLAGGRFALTGGYWASFTTQPTGETGGTLLLPFLGSNAAATD